MQKQIKTSGENIDFYSTAIGSAAEFSFEEFLKWFNVNANITEVINSGYKDFFGEILKKRLYHATRKNSKEMTAMEIGCGGGRITNAACKYFGKVLGFDIHDHLSLTEKFLRSQGNENFKLDKITNDRFSAEDNSIDFIYSYIVFQHILKMNCFENYAEEIVRMLKDKGLAIIYFGRPRFFTRIMSNNILLNTTTFILDRLIFEGIFLNLFKNGYEEHGQVKESVVNLVVTMRKAKAVFRRNGLKILEKGFTRRNKSFGTQYYLILSK